MTSGDRVFVSQGQLGRGIYARWPIRAGQTILEFEGPVLSHREVLEMGEGQAYALQIGPDQYLDTSPPGRYTNHSCQPNAGIMADRRLVALRDISHGEEIRFDYSTTMSEDHWTMTCACGSPGCRRVIGDFHLLPLWLQAYYIGLGVVQSFIAKKWRGGKLHSA